MNQLQAFNQYQMLMHKIANKFCAIHPGIADDIRNGARMGLWDVSARYDEVGESGFKSFAGAAIKNHILNIINDMSPIRSKVAKKREEHHLPPVVFDYVDASDPERRHELYSIYLQLQAPRPDYLYEKKEEIELMNKHLSDSVSRLPKKHKDIIEGFFFKDGVTMATLAKEVGVSRQRIGQIKDEKILPRLKNSMRRKRQVRELMDA